MNIYSKYAWVILLKDKKGITITNAFFKKIDESNRKPNKIWVDKGSEFYNRSMKSWLEKNDIEMYSVHNEGKSVITEKIFRNLKSKIYKYMTSVSRNVCIDKLDDIVNKYNNTFHSAIKMKPIDVKSNTYIDSHEDPNLKLVILLEYQNIEIFLQKVTLQINLKRFLWLKKLKILCRRHILLMILTEKKLLELFTKTNCKIQIKKNLELKK